MSKRNSHSHYLSQTNRKTDNSLLEDQNRKNWKPLLTHLKRDAAHGRKAPYKFLLLLWMIGRYLNGMGPSVSYQNAEVPLKQLMEDFKIGSSFKPSLPFVHLANEPKLWSVTTTTGSDIYKLDINSKRNQSFLRREAIGSLSQELIFALEDSETCKEIIESLLSYFPNEDREKILSLTGLSNRETNTTPAKETVSELDTWGFSRRTSNCLKSAGIQTESALVALSDEQLLSIKNFGSKCLNEVKAQLKIRSANKFEKNMQAKSEFHPWNLSVRTTNCFKSAGIETKEQLISLTKEELLNLRGFGSTSFNEVMTHLDRENLSLRQIYTSDIVELRRTGLASKEIANKMRLSESQVKRYLQIHDLAASGLTLQEIGEAVELSRERIRQVLQNNWPELAQKRYLLSKVRKKELAAKTKSEEFEKMKISFHAKTGVSAYDVLGHLRKSKSTKKTADFYSLSQGLINDLYELTPHHFPKCYTGSQYRTTNEEILENLKEAYKTLDKGKLTMQMYEGFRLEMNTTPIEKKSAWVHHQSIIRRFGGWQKALKKADIPTFEIGEWLHDVPSFTDIELIDFLLKAYNQLAQGKLSFNMYKEYRDTQDEYWPDAPLMQRRFGSWNKALEAAGIPTTTRRVGSGKNYSKEELLNFLRTAYYELDEGQLTISMYENYVDENNLPWPKETALYKRLGKWSTCLKIAGIPTTTGRGPGKSYSKKELLNFLRDAYTELGQERLSATMYQNFSAQQQSELPGIGSFVGAFGSWNKALQSAGLPINLVGSKEEKDKDYQKVKYLSDEEIIEDLAKYFN